MAKARDNQKLKNKNRFPDEKSVFPTEILLPFSHGRWGIFFFLLFPTVCFANIAVETIALEAGNQSFEGQVAVASVIKTRMVERRQTAEQVVKSPHQFSCWNGAHRKVTKRELEVAQKAWDQAVAGEYNHYCRFDVKPYWIKSAKKSIRVGDHIFYKL